MSPKPRLAAARPALDLAAVLQAMPIGVAVFDAEQRSILVNAAYAASLLMPPDSFPPGTALVDMLRISAHRGLFGPGDPEAQIAAALQLDRGRPGRLRRRRHDGRSYDLHSVPLPQGGHLVCAVETTALTAAREEAEATAARLVRSVASLRTGLAVFDARGQLSLHNASFAELLELPAGLLATGTSLADIVRDARTLDEYAGLDSEAFLAGQLALDRTRVATTRRLRTDGTVIDLASDPLPDGGWTLSVTDVSALARAEDEARRRAAMLNGILESIPHGVCVYGPDRRVTMVNRAYGAIMSGAPIAVGDHRDEVIRRRAAAGEYGSGRREQMIAEQMAFDVTRPQVRRRRRPNGTTIDVRTAPLPDGGYLSVVTDVTPLMRAEDEVSRRAEELDVMLANIRHGIILWDREARVVASNRIAAELLEQPPGVVVRGRPQAEILAGAMPEPAKPEPAKPEPAKPGPAGPAPAGLPGGLAEPAFASPFATHSAGVEAAANDTARVQRRLMPSGRMLELRSDPGPDGGSVSTFTDVTDMHAAAAELHRAKAAAEAANQAKSRFLATMSHELRTPLNAVIGFSDTLSRDGGGDDPDRVAEFAQAINQAGRQLLTLVNNILDVARIDAGRFDISLDWIDLARLVAACVRQIDPAAQAAEVALTCALPADLPQLRADERRFRQILQQLLSNAVKFTPAGGSVTIDAALDPAGDLLIRVADTGIGIAAADLQRVFEPFGQIDASLARPFSGSGLGLYISRALVQAHGGQLVLHSAPGIGTTAEIRLPGNRLAAREPPLAAQL